MEIKEIEFNSIKDLIKKFYKNNENELEIRFLNNNSNNSKNITINHSIFERVRNYLIFNKDDG